MSQDIAPHNPNRFIGITLLIVLGVFVVPNLLPQFIADLSPHLFASIPCDRLPAAADLPAHQSAIGRAVQDPLLLEVAAADIGADDALLLRLTITNTSLGTVPLVYQADTIAVAGAEAAGDGLGIIIEPPPAFGSQEDRPSPASTSEAGVRLLGPRQKCSHSIEITAAPAMIAGGGTARAYYRISSAGDHPPQSAGARQIYDDQGLDILRENPVYSQPAPIKPRS